MFPHDKEKTVREDSKNNDEIFRLDFDAVRSLNKKDYHQLIGHFVLNIANISNAHQQKIKKLQTNKYFVNNQDILLICKCSRGKDHKCTYNPFNFRARRDLPPYDIVLGNKCCLPCSGLAMWHKRFLLFTQCGYNLKLIEDTKLLRRCFESMNDLLGFRFINNKIIWSKGRYQLVLNDHKTRDFTENNTAATDVYYNLEKWSDEPEVFSLAPIGILPQKKNTGYCHHAFVIFDYSSKGHKSLVLDLDSGHIGNVTQYRAIINDLSDGLIDYDESLYLGGNVFAPPFDQGACTAFMMECAVHIMQRVYNDLKVDFEIIRKIAKEIKLKIDVIVAYTQKVKEEEMKKNKNN